MKEQFPTPHNPSEAFAQQSKQEHNGRHESVLDSEAAAYAAKPWMDVAVDLHEAKNQADWVDEGESVYDHNAEGSLNDLTAYAEKRAHQAANGEREDDVLTPIEEKMLDAYKAEAEMAQAAAKVDIDALSAEQIDAAWDMVDDRARAARRSGDMAEMHKWDKLGRRAQEFNELFFAQGMDEDERHVLERKLRPNAGDAGYVLSMLDADGVTMRGSGSDRQRYSNQVLADTKNMRETAALYELFAEVQAQSAQHEAPKGVPQSALNDMLKKQYELVAQQEADFAGQVDPDVLEDADFSEADKQIYGAIKLARRQGDEAALQQWQSLHRGRSEYKNAFINGEQDQLPEDINALMRRRDFMRFLASVNPRQEGASAQPNTQERAASPEEKIFGEVLAAAKNNVIIHTDQPSGVELRVGNTKENRGGKGFGTFGSSSRVFERQVTNFMDTVDVTEAVQFQRTTKQPIYEEGVNKKRFGKDEPYKILKGHEDVLLPRVLNARTGQQEPGVAFHYKFHSKDYNEAGLYKVNDGRPGNMLKVEAILPETVAAQLEQLVRQNPAAVREIVHRLVVAEGNVPEGVWNGTQSAGNEYDPDRKVAAMRPPYDKLPGDWAIGLYGDEAMKGSQYTALKV